jgi:hypothetical protein
MCLVTTYTKQLKKLEQTSNAEPPAFICTPSHPEKGHNVHKIAGEANEMKHDKGLHTKFETHQWTSVERNPRKFLSANARCGRWIFI